MTPTASPTNITIGPGETTYKPTLSPTSLPTRSPSNAPVRTSVPSLAPTRSPSTRPSPSPVYNTTQPTKLPSHAPVNFTLSPTPSGPEIAVRRIVSISLPFNNLSGIIDVEALNNLTDLVYLNLFGNPQLSLPAGSSCIDLNVCRNYYCNISSCN